MKPKWTGQLVGKMHVHGITQAMIAEHLGVTPAWVSMALNGKAGKKTQERITKAVDELMNT